MQAKLEGGEVKAPAQPKKSTGEVVDLLAALQRSVDAAKSSRGEKVAEPASERGGLGGEEKPAKKAAAKKATTKKTARRRPRRPRPKKAAAKKAASRRGGQLLLTVCRPARSMPAYQRPNFFQRVPRQNLASGGATAGWRRP